ncbi:MAG: OmpA family protein [Bacteroidales bacterium]|nr:OmpA family protein [Bacteroidales bacterium]
MKTKVTILMLLFSFFFGTVIYAQPQPKKKKGFWDRVSDIATGIANVCKATGISDIAEAYVVGKTADFYEKNGYSKEEAQKNASMIGDALGVSKSNTERGIAWNDASNMYQQLDALSYDSLARHSNNPDDRRKYLAQTSLTYAIGCLDEAYKGDKGKATVMGILAVGDILFEKERIDRIEDSISWSNYLEEQKAKREMESHFRDIGVRDYTDEDLENCANYVLAVAKTDKLSEKEKTDYLAKMGIMESPQEVLNRYGMDSQAELRRQEELKRQKEEEERRIAEEKRLAEQRAAEERKNALQNLDIIKVDGYALDETELSDAQKTDLNEAANILNKYTDVNVLLTGHTCKIGYKNINQRKGMKRAEAVKEYLMSKGVSENRITIDSKGETDPLVPNTSKENFKQNRRVEIQINN